MATQFVFPSRRTLAWIAASLLALLVIGLLAVRWFAASGPGRGFAEARIEALSISGQTIQIDGLGGDLFGTMNLKRLEVSDEDGVWLTADRVRLDWSPSALIGGTLRIRTLAAETVSIERQPTLEPASSSAERESGGGFLKGYVLDQIELSEIQLAESVAGPAMRYTLTGRGQYSGDAGSVAVNLAPLDPFGDRLVAAMSWSPREALEGAVDLSGEPGGLLSELLRVQGRESISARLDASQTSDGWRLTSAGLIGETQWFDVNGRKSGSTVDLSGTIDLRGSAYSAVAADRFGSSLRFEAASELGGAKQPIDISVFTDAGELSLSAELTETADGRTADPLRIRLSDLDATRLSGIQDLTVQTITLNGVVVQTGSDINFDGEARTQRLDYADYAIAAPVIDGGVSWTSGRFATDLTLAAQFVQGVPELKDAEVGASLTAQYNAASRRVQLGQLDVIAGSLGFSAEGTLSADGSAELVGQFTAQDMDGLPAHGRGSWALDRATSGAMTLTSNADVHFSGGSAAVGDLLGSPVQLDIKVQQTEQGVFEIQPASLVAPKGRVDVTGTRTDSSIDLAARLQMAAGQSAGVSFGPVTADLDVSGTLEQPLLALTAATVFVETGGRRLDYLNVETRLTPQNGISGPVSFSAAYNGDPIEIDAIAALGGSSWRLDEVIAQFSDYRLTGLLSGENADPEAAFAALTVSTASDTEMSDLSGKIDLSAGTLNATIDLSNAEWRDLRVRNAELEIDGRWPAFAVSGQMDAVATVAGLESALTTTQSAEVNLETQRATLVVDTDWGGSTIETLSPLEIAWRDQLALKVRLALFGGVSDLDFTGSPAELDGALLITDVNLSELAVRFGRPAIEGQFGAAFKIDTEGDAILADGEMNLVGLSRGGPNDPVANVAVTASLQPDALRARVRATDGDDSLDLNGTFEAPVSSSVSGLSIGFVENAPARLAIIGGGVIAPLWSLIAPPDLRAEGTVDVDLTGSGPVRDLFPKGEVRLIDGVFEDGQTGVLLKDITLSAQLDREALKVDALSASGGRGGRLRGEGEYRFDGDASIDIEFNKLDAVDRSDITTTVSGRIDIGRRDGASRIGGDLTLDETRVDISKLPGAGYTTLDVSFGDESDAEESAEEDPRPVALDLSIVADRRVFVTGPAVDTEWSLDLDVNGTLGAPELGGRADIVRGEADLIGRRFRFTDGALTFDGDPEATRARIIAERAAGGVTVTLSVTGPVMEPDIALSSSPELPEDEVLSRVLFGQSASELSPLQAAQLAAAAASLAGGGSAFDLTSPLQEAVGLDRLDLGVSAAGGASLSAGRYLADDVYLEVETGASGAPGVALEWTPLSNLEVDANIDPEVGPRLAIQWKRDFDLGPDTAGQTDQMLDDVSSDE